MVEQPVPPALSAQVRVTDTAEFVHVLNVYAPLLVAVGVVVGATASNNQLVLLPELTEFVPMALISVPVLFESLRSI